MNNRREFFKTVAAAGALTALGAPAAELSTPDRPRAGDPPDDRRYWLAVLEKLAQPVLSHLAKRQLKAVMPVEAPGNAADRRRYTHLEAFGRLLAGIAPWLGAALDGPEARLQRDYLALTHQALDAATDPQSADYLNFNQGGQALVDSAFLAQAILRAPAALWDPLEPRVRRQLTEALKASRAIGNPKDSNWVMFSATVEAALLHFGEPTIEDRLEGSLRRMLGWYKGDGAYGDGEWFHFDYYNSYVIHPMLIDVLERLRRQDNSFEPAYATALARAQRYAEVQERFIAPDGTFPALGRSIAYRFGALQVLAQMAWRQQLPEHLKPAQVRAALTAVIRRMIEAPGTFDEQGWLRIGFCGHQASLGERYISTGSLYLCATGLLPLGLPPTRPFWADPPAPWTAQRLWSGESLPADHAMKDTRTVTVPGLKREPPGG